MNIMRIVFISASVNELWKASYEWWRWSWKLKWKHHRIVVHTVLSFSISESAFVSTIGEVSVLYARIGCKNEPEQTMFYFKNVIGFTFNICTISVLLTRTKGPQTLKWCGLSTHLYCFVNGQLHNCTTWTVWLDHCCPTSPLRLKLSAASICRNASYIFDYDRKIE